MSCLFNKVESKTKSRPLKEPYKVMVMLSTRPDFIKLSPLMKAINESGLFKLIPVHTGQHKEMAKGILSQFGIKENEIKYDLMSMGKGGHLHDVFDFMATVLKGTRLEKTLMEKASLVSRGLKSIRQSSRFHFVDMLSYMAPRIMRIISIEKPDMMIIQGDTTSTFAAKIAADFHDLPVAYVEAGLRTHDRSPFPEELQRIYSSCYHLHTMYFAPSIGAKRNLIREGIPAYKISVTGNTVIDALNSVKHRRADLDFLALPKNKKIILFTCHRKEALENRIKEIFGMIKSLAVKYEDKIHFVFPVHRNPEVRKAAKEFLSGVKNIQLIEPLGYLEVVRLMKKCHMVVTDSGGFQEEAPALGVPVVILRDVTERPEVVKNGTAVLAGTRRPEEITRVIENLLAGGSEYKRMARPVFPYGRGDASIKILRHLIYSLYQNEKGVNISRAIGAAADWIVSSGIQTEHGNFSGYYDSRKKEYAFAYPEATGYGILSLLGLAKRDRNPGGKYIEKAKDAGAWILKQMHDLKLDVLPARHYYDFKNFTVPEHQKYCYAFDNGIIIHGLSELYTTTGEKKYLEAAEKMAKFLIDVFKIDTEHPFVCYDQARKTAINPGIDWSTVSGPFLAKISEAFISLFKHTGDKKYLKTAISLCDRALEKQDKSGRFITSPSGQITHGHPHCYAAEGLISTGAFLIESGIDSVRGLKFFMAAARANKWLFENMMSKSTGEIKCLFENDELKPYERSDVLAQALYIGVSLINFCGLLDLKNMKKWKSIFSYVIHYDIMAAQNKYLPLVARRLIENYQNNQKDAGAHVRGGFGFGTDEFSGTERTSDINSWCTMFAIKALNAYKELLNKTVK